MRPLPGDEVWIGQHCKAGERADLAARLWPKVRGPWYSGLCQLGWTYEIGDDDCWFWIPTTRAGEWRMRNGRRVRATVGGYGRIHVIGDDGSHTLIGAHVAAYLVTHGPFPPDHVIDHFRCQARLCCNPRHLRAIPVSENVRAGWETRRRRREVAA